MSHVVIVGSGFAGLTSVRELRKNGHSGPITVISPQARFDYYPSSIWIPSGLRRVQDLQLPLANFFQRQKVTHKAAQATGLDLARRMVQTNDGEVAFDALIIASGGRYLQKLPGITDHALIPCASVETGEQLRQRLETMDGGTLAFGFASNPNEPAAMRGGPVFEFLFGTDTLLRRQGRRDRFELMFFSPAAEPGKRLGGKAVEGLLREMKKRGISTHLGHKLKAFTGHSVETEGGEFKADLVMFMPGMTGPAFVQDSGLPLSPGGFVQAGADGRVPGQDKIYVAGDAGSFPGPDWMPKQAHMADLQAAAVAKNLIADLNGKTAQHGFKTELVCIVDSLDSGTLVYRDMKRARLFKAPFMHHLKRLFEWMYLRNYR